MAATKAGWTMRRFLCLALKCGSGNWTESVVRGRREGSEGAEGVEEMTHQNSKVNRGEKNGKQ